MRTAKVEDLSIDYEKDGELKRFRYKATWREEGRFGHASVSFHEGQKKISIRAVKADQWLQYNRMISAERLFEKLNQVSIKELNPEGDFAYYGLMFGGWDNFGINNEEIFIIEKNNIVPFTGELPVESYWMQTFGMVQTGENSYSSSHEHYYLFDVRYK